MRAVVQVGYGRPSEVLHVREPDLPSVWDDEVLVRSHPAGRQRRRGDASGSRRRPQPTTELNGRYIRGGAILRELNAAPLLYLGAADDNFRLFVEYAL
jgi:hypothetical protein